MSRRAPLRPPRDLALLVLAIACSPPQRNFYPAPPEETQNTGGQGGAGGSRTTEPTCAEDACGIDSRCELIDGTPTCICDDGYERDGDTCQDVDECEGSPNPCGETAICNNLPGSYECVCNDGHFYDGSTCQPLTRLVSIGLDGEAGDEPSGYTAASVSGDGRHVAFDSSAANLVPEDSDFVDVFVRGMSEGSTRRISVSPAGMQANGDSRHPSISFDGRYVAFESAATNLAADDTNGFTDIFIRDLTMGTTRRVTNPEGVQGNGHSTRPLISGNGRFVAFQSLASNLAPIQEPDGWTQILLHDSSTGLTRALSVNAEGAPGNNESRPFSISHDGRFVLFRTGASNLVESDAIFKLVLCDTTQTPPTLTVVGEAGTEMTGSISDDGAIVATTGPGPTFGSLAVVVRDVETGDTTVVSVNQAGESTTGISAQPAITADGRTVAFFSSSNALVDDDSNGDDVFVRDLQEGITTRASIGSMGEESDADSMLPAISRDGRFVAFRSQSSTFGYAGGTDQIYLRYIGSE